MRGRCSICALMLQRMAPMPKRAAPAIRVLPFQLAGCEYQPPAGDHTCFGYLLIQRTAVSYGRHHTRFVAGGYGRATNGILPPPPIVEFAICYYLCGRGGLDRTEADRGGVERTIEARMVRKRSLLRMEVGVVTGNVRRWWPERPTPGRRL